MRDDNRRGRENDGLGNDFVNPFGSGRRRSNGANGVHPEGMRTRSIPIEHTDEPIDLVALQADDELINALAEGMSVSSPGAGGYDTDDRVAAILAAWKAEVDAEPFPELVDVDTALAAIVAARPDARRRSHLVPVAVAAAFLVFAIGGVSIGSSTSKPGDALWAVSKVLYSERAESVEAAARVETHIAKAKQALMQGQPAVAELELKQAAVDLPAVRPEEGQTELAKVQDFLADKAEETPSGTKTDPGAPLVTNPDRAVPAGAAIDEPALPEPAAPTPTPAPEPAPPTTTDPAPPADTAPDASKTLENPQAGPSPEPTTVPTIEPVPTTTVEPDPTPTVTPSPSATAEGGPDATSTPGVGDQPVTTGGAEQGTASGDTTGPDHGPDSAGTTS